MTTENAAIIPETELDAQPMDPKLVLDNPYVNDIYSRSFDHVEYILSNVAFADGRKLTDLLGADNLRSITGFITGDVILPLANVMGDFHATANTMMGTTFKTLQDDLCLHKTTDVFLLQQSIIQLAISTNIYFDPKQFDGQFPESDGWSFNLMLLNDSIEEKNKAAGIVTAEGEVPYRNEYIEVVDIKGVHHKNCRFVNFTYQDTNAGEHIVTDIPAIWSDDLNEYLLLPYILKWRFANKLPSTDADDAFNAVAIAKGFIPQTTETYEQVHQERKKASQEAAEAAEVQRKKDAEAAASQQATDVEGKADEINPENFTAPVNEGYDLPRGKTADVLHVDDAGFTNDAAPSPTSE